MRSYKKRLEELERETAPKKHTSIVIETGDAEFKYAGKIYPIERLQEIAESGAFMPGMPPVIEINLTDEADTKKQTVNKNKP